MKVIRVINKQERIELIKEIAAYYIENNGEMTLHELADTYGRPYGTVYNWMMNQLPKIDAELYSQFRLNDAPFLAGHSTTIFSKKFY